MTQASLAERFQTSIANADMHIRNIYKAGELSEESTIKLDLKVQKEGSRTVNRALKNTHSSKERNDSGPLAFPWCLLIILVGWSQNHGPPRRRETSLLFSFYVTEREENMERLRRRRRGFWAGRSPFSPIGRCFRISWPIRGSQNEDRLSFRTRRQMRLPRTCGA